MRITIQYNSTGYSTCDICEASGVMIWWGKGVVRWGDGTMGCGEVLEEQSRERANS